MAAWGWVFILLLIYAVLERRRAVEREVLVVCAYKVGYSQGRVDENVVADFPTGKELRQQAVELLQCVL